MSLANRWKWGAQIDTSRAYCRAGGRRRYNAERQRRADRRRLAMVKALASMGYASLFFTRGVTAVFARAFGVHRTTAWRDLQRILWPPTCNFYQDGELLFTITRACQGGPIIDVTDPDGNEIRGAERRDILRRVPRYLGKG